MLKSAYACVCVENKKSYLHQRSGGLTPAHISPPPTRVRALHHLQQVWPLLHKTYIILWNPSSVQSDHTLNQWLTDALVLCHWLDLDAWAYVTMNTFIQSSLCLNQNIFSVKASHLAVKTQKDSYTLTLLSLKKNSKPFFSYCDWNINRLKLKDPV